jgi:N-acetylglucosamine kinase-like BadF-type ATPase
MRCILGIDGGGTKCHAILVRDDGQVLGWGQSDQKGKNDERHRVFGGRGRSYYSILKAVVQAIGRIDCDELHIASVNNALPLDFLRQDRPMKIQVHPISEYSAAFAQAGETYGIVALSGTGSIVYGKTRDGRAVYLDGLGPLLGDHGSGYDIGLRAIRAAAMAGWHPRHATSFANDIYRSCGGKANDRRGLSLIKYMIERRDRSAIANLARFVTTAAENGDRVAQSILEEAAADLAATVYDAVDILEISKEPYKLIGTGGIITHSNIYWNHLCKLVKKFAPRLRPTRSDLPAVVGVALSAMLQLPSINIRKAKTLLFKSTRSMLNEKTPPI